MPPVSDSFVEFEGQLNQQDIMRGFLLNRRTRWRPMMYGAIWFMLAVASFLYFQGSIDLPSSTVWLLVAAALIGIAQLFLVPVFASHTLRQQTALFLPFRARIDTNGFHSESTQDVSQRPWNAFRYWKEDKASFVLAESPGAIRIIPKRFLQNQEAIARLRSLLAAHLGKAA